MHRIAAAISTTVVIVALIAGLYLSGSPSEQRLLRLDERRVDDLKQIAITVERFWEEQGELPADLPTLVDGRRLNQLLVDPETGHDYDYAHTTDTFRLCAVFNRPSEEAETMQFWQHPAGQHCFDFDTSELSISRDTPTGRLAPALPIR
jgi:hypothetical protein